MNWFWSDRFLDTENEWAKHVRVLTVLPEIFINGSSLPQLAEYQSTEEAARMVSEGMEKAKVHSSISSPGKQWHRAPAGAQAGSALPATSPLLLRDEHYWECKLYQKGSQRSPYREYRMCLLGWNNVWTGDPSVFVTKMWFPGMSVIPAEDNHHLWRLNASTYQAQPRLFGLDSTETFPVKHSTSTMHSLDAFLAAQ